MVGGTTESDFSDVLRVHGYERSKKKQKQQQNPFPLWLEAQLKSKTASLPTPLDYGSAGNAVKGQDERPTAGRP
jgi:hypothetical protein